MSLDAALRDLQEQDPLATPVDLEDLLERKMPAREWLLEGLIQERDLGMIHAFRGVGKSRVAHGIAIAVAGGGQFLRWKATRPAGVLLVDGELPREELQEMLASAVAGGDPEPTAPLRILSADVSEAPLLSLSSDEGRDQMERHLDGISLLILDSISTLCRGAGPENDAESWDEMQSWLLRLRRRGLSTLFLHHDGKGKSQRGTSKREDVLSTVVQLIHPSDYRPSEGARFELHYQKARGIIGEAAAPFEAMLQTDPNGRAIWTWRNLEDAMAIRARHLSDEGLKQREIARELGIGLGTVNRALKRMK